MNTLLVFAILGCLVTSSLGQCAAGKVACGATGCCDADTQLCCRNPNTGADSCVSHDSNNCGACGVTCTSTKDINEQTCTDKKCKCVSTENTLACGGLCVNPTLITSCGSCRNRCGSGQTCTAGICTCAITTSKACPTGCFTEAQLQTNEENCGGCGVHCPPGHRCLAGKCTADLCANAGEIRCFTDRCINLLTDINNCGECGHACSTAGTKCDNGACVDDTTPIADTVFTAVGSAFSWTADFDNKFYGETITVRSSRSYPLAPGQALSAIVIAAGIPTNAELHVYIAQTESNDRSFIREVAIFPARPAVLKASSSSVTVTTALTGKLTYLINLRLSNSKRSITNAEETEAAINFKVTLREQVINLPATGKVNVNLSFDSMYTGL